MEEVEFKKAMAPAIRFIMQKLPDKHVDVDEVCRQATDLLAGNMANSGPAKSALRRLADISPRCYGADRRKEYWRIARQYLTCADIVNLYLGQFPGTITTGERKAIRKILIEKLAVEPNCADELLKKFRLYLGRSPREKEYCGFDKYAGCPRHLIDSIKNSRKEDK